MPERESDAGAAEDGRLNSTSVAELAAGVRSGDRTMVARAITLIESVAESDLQRRSDLITQLLPHAAQSIRIGVTGLPGAGKSTFLDKLGRFLTAQKHKVAVLAVDPSSSLTSGSILGDKTRMPGLAVDPNAFIRPSPSGGKLGGVAGNTREAILVFEAAGYNVIFVETIGVGQNETVVRSMVDFFLLLMIPGAGDELQGIKRGVMEMVDAIVVNKADGDLESLAKRTAHEYERAARYMTPITPDWSPPATAISALEGTGIDTVWDTIERFRETVQTNGTFEHRRREQSLAWLDSVIQAELARRFSHHPAVNNLRTKLEGEVVSGNLPAVAAARQLLDAFSGNDS